MADIQQQLVDSIEDARNNKISLRLQGDGSKGFLLPSGFDAKRTLELTRHHGIISYEPSELVITARGGTSLHEIISLLDENGQILPFEPPCYGNRGTIGGAIASGIGGPARPWRGAPRDALLGIKLLDGAGRVVEFGGQVMKNVAGYDVSRLMCGAMGTLGILLEVSIRLLPRPRVEKTLKLARDYDASRSLLNRLRRQAVPLSGAFWVDDTLHLRLSASSESSMQKLQQQEGGAWLEENHLWQDLRDQQLDFFNQQNHDLWRLSTPPSAVLPEQAAHLVDWGGAQHWIMMRSGKAESMHALARSAGGYAQSWHANEAELYNNKINKLENNIKAVFDPLSLLNPGIKSLQPPSMRGV